MNAYGETAAERLIDDNAIVVMAALDGDLAALKALLSLGLQSAYIDGYSGAASVVGVSL